MKIKKDKLKEIIKEEINNYLDEVIDGQFELEEEVPEPSDEDHLFNLLTKEFDRIPQEKRRSVYTRFLSAANKYADKVSANQAPVPTDVNLSESLILEELSEVLIDENVLAKVGDFLLKKMGIAKDKAQEALGFVKQIMQAKKKYNLDMKNLEKFAQSQGAGLSLNENVYKIMPKPVATALAKANLGLMNAIGSKATVRVLKALKIGVPVMMALAILTDAGDAFAGVENSFDAMTQDPDFGKNGQRIVTIVRSASEAGGDVAAGVSGIDPDFLASKKQMSILANQFYKMQDAFNGQPGEYDAYQGLFDKYLGNNAADMYEKYMTNIKNGKNSEWVQKSLANEFGGNLTPEQIIKALNNNPPPSGFTKLGVKVISKMLTGKMI